jgi:predicted ThiF/HesA family dinucleotide-utilizing enzyme
MNIVIVLLACATGITVPVTISIILVLRSRGICCVAYKAVATEQSDQAQERGPDGGA